LFQSVANARTGVPPRPANVTTPGVPETGLIASASKEFILLLASRRGSSASTQAVVHGQTARDTPIVLRVEAPVGCTRLNQIRDLHVARIDLAKQKRCERVAGIRSAKIARDERREREASGRPAIADLVIGAAAEFATQLERVAPLRPGHRFEHWRSRIGVWNRDTAALLSEA
jgi:hypothetical protein